jgi:hypothetical protein
MADDAGSDPDTITTAGWPRGIVRKADFLRTFGPDLLELIADRAIGSVTRGELHFNGS